MSVIRKDLGIATAYGYAVSKGYTGTEEEFAELMASYATVAEEAQEAAEQATQAVQTAQAAVNTATTKAGEAATSASGAATSASQAGQSATAAAGSASTASAKAAEAGTSATNAAASETVAIQSAQTAATKAGEASASATAASQSATAAAGSASDASDDADRAETAAGSVSAAAEQIATNTADIADLKDDLTDLETAFDAVVESTDVWSDPVPEADITRIKNKQINSASNVVDKSGFSILYWQADEDGFYDCVLSKSQAQNTARVYSSSDFSSSAFVKNVTELSNSHFQVELTAGQYLATSAWYLDYTVTIKRSEGKVYSVPEIEEEIKAEEDNIFPNGWVHLPVENFSRNEWNSYNGTTSRNYRVKYDLPLQFNRDVTLLAAPGFYVSGYKSDGTAFQGTTENLPANTLFKIYVRRISENSSEIADIEEFANALTISTPLAGMEKYKHTFTDVTMFPRIGISGDSFSAGGGVISGISELTWGKNLERESGVTVDLYAKSGETIGQWNVDETNGLPALLAGEECGLYWFAHGINGTSTDAALGTPEDMSANPKPQTFYGQYVYAIETIQRMFPKARLVIATIMGTGYSLYQTKYAKVNAAIRNIAEYCNIPVVDLADDDFYKSIWYDTYHLGNHPTAMLNAGIAHANRRILAKTIMENATYFMDYGDKYNYAVSCPVVTGGYVTASPSIVASGETVTLSYTAYTGYHFVGYTSEDVTITDGSFTMPAKKVTITGVFEAD